MVELIKWIVGIGGTALIGVWLWGICQISLEWMYRKALPEPPEPQKIDRLIVGGSPYLVQGDKILDVGRALIMSLDGLANDPNVAILEWEGKRRILHSSPTISMKVVQQALDGGPKALPMPEIKVLGGERKDVVDL